MCHSAAVVPDQGVFGRDTSHCQRTTACSSSSMVLALFWSRLRRSCKAETETPWCSRSLHTGVPSKVFHRRNLLNPPSSPRTVCGSSETAGQALHDDSVLAARQRRQLPLWTSRPVPRANSLAASSSWSSVSTQQASALTPGAPRDNDDSCRRGLAATCCVPRSYKAARPGVPIKPVPT